MQLHIDPMHDEAASKTGKRPTATAVTTERLRQLILTGQLGAGQVLRQDELSAYLSVSRTPLREAIITLEAEGLVVTHPHKGAVVYKPTANELREIYEIRIMLETRAAREATEKMTPDVLAEVERIIDQLIEASGAARIVELNEAFRHTFYSASGKPLLVEMIHSVTLRAEPYVNLLVGGPRRPFTRGAFQPLLDAIHARDSARAATVTRKHLEKTVKGLLPTLERWDRPV
jgi:DNA-binding GntR family transcriptional regulator